MIYARAMSSRLDVLRCVSVTPHLRYKLQGSHIVDVIDADRVPEQLQNRNKPCANKESIRVSCQGLDELFWQGFGSFGVSSKSPSNYLVLLFRVPTKVLVLLLKGPPFSLHCGSLLG